MSTLQRVMLDEFETWLRLVDAGQESTLLPEERLGHVCPRPHVCTGLPHGWTRVSDWCSPTPSTCWALARRPVSGWALVRYCRTVEETELVRAERTLDGLHESLSRRGIRRAQGGGGPYDGLPTWIDSTISAMYDTADPDEAAAQMLFALSGEILLLPKSAA